MKTDILTTIINKLMETGLDELDAQMMLTDLLIELKYQNIITFKHENDKVNSTNIQ